MSALNRFVEAQQADYDSALSEIKKEKKTSHWMWYVFPQIYGLGFSSTSKFYAIKDINEANEYLNHPVLGLRLINICKELLNLPTNDPHQIFGSPDDVKLQSSMTLFSLAFNSSPVFQQVLDKFFNGAQDQKTLKLVDNK